LNKNKDIREYSEDAKDKNGEWQDLVEHCFNLFDSIDKSEYRQDKIAKIKESYRIYEQKDNNSSWPWKNASNVVLPMTTITVDNLEPRLVAGIVGRKPVVQFDMAGLTKRPIEMEIVQDWFNEELETVVGIQDVAGTITHKALLEGTVYPIADYDEEDRTIRDFKFNERGQIVVDENDGVITEDKTESVFKGGKVQYAEFTDVFIPDDADDWEKTDVIRIVRPTYAELMRKKDTQGYRNIGIWLLRDEDTEKTIEEDEQTPLQNVEGITVTGRETIECLECCVSYIFKTDEQEKEDIDDFTEERYVATIAKNSKILVRLRLLRELNFKNEHLVKRIRLFKEKGKAYGTSIYEKIMSIQNGASDIFNMVVNVATVTMIPWFMYTDSAGIDGEATITPGKGVKVDDVSQVMFPKFNQNPRSYIVFIEMFMSLWEKLGSIGDIQIGRLSESRKDATATETMAAIQEGNIKHNYQSFAFKDDFISLIRTIYDLYYQKMPYSKAFIYHGQEVPIPRAIMNRPYKFKLVGSSDLANKVLEMQKNQQLYGMIRQDPFSNPMTLLKDIAEVWKPDADPSEYINPVFNQFAQILEQNPEIMNVIKQYLQSKQIAQAPEGAEMIRAKTEQEKAQTDKTLAIIKSKRDDALARSQVAKNIAEAKGKVNEPVMEILKGMMDQAKQDKVNKQKENARTNNE